MTMLPFDNDDQVSLDGENTPDESGDLGDLGTEANPPISDDDDAPLTDADLAHAKHAAAVATGQASVAPPPIEAPPATDAPKQRNRRKDAGQPRAPRKPRSGDPITVDMLAPPSDTHVSITLNPIDGKLTTEAINAAAAHATKEPGIPCDLAPSEVVDADDFHAATDVCDLTYCVDMRKLARRRLKSVARFATRASEISRMWPRNPDGFFTAAFKLSDDIERFSETNAAHAMHAAALCTKLFPKDTRDVLTMSELVFVQ